MEKLVKEFDVRSYEVDEHAHLRLRSLFNFFQDMGDSHANIMGLGYRFCKEKSLGWIGAAYHVIINELPKWEDKVTLATWPSAATAVTGVRDFRMTDAAGQVLVNATSQWVLVDMNKMRPMHIAKAIGTYELIHERAVEGDFAKLPDVERVDFEVDRMVRVDDIDINRHVNNAVYPTWALDGLPPAFLEKHTIGEFQIAFKKAAVAGDKIKIRSQIEGLETRHMITNEDGTGEFARVKIGWKSR